MSTASTDLPAELWHAIIFFAAEKSSSLTNLSLVCREFHACCRQHIFRSITLDNRSHRSTRDLVTLLQESPEVAVHIRYLSLAPCNGDLDVEHLPSVIQMITRLETLDITSPAEKALDWKTWPKTDIERKTLRSTLGHLFGLPSLHTLSFTDIDNFPASAVHLLKNIRSLSMIYTSFWDDCHYQSSSFDEPGDASDSILVDREDRVPVRLDTLEFFGTTNDAGTYQLLILGSSGTKALFDFTQLKEVSIGSTIRGIGWPIQCFSRSLEQLEMTFRRDDPIEGIASQLTKLSPALRKLSLSITLKQDNTQRRMRNLQAELGVLKTDSKLSQIKIVFHFFVFRTLLNLDDEWRALDGVLSEDGWAKLEKITMRVTRTAGVVEAADLPDEILDAHPGDPPKAFRFKEDTIQL